MASWDNLTNKGVIRDHPDLMIVWNEAQRREAIELHGLSPDRVVATGAHTYDHWFDWRPSRTRREFCERAGLDPERPFLLYVASSYFIAREEPHFVARWIDFLHRSSSSELRDAGVLIRPHPTNPTTWDHDGIADPRRVAVFPLSGTKPTRAEAKADYFDSLYYAGVVVGLNTSALIEAGIVGRPVLSLLLDENREGQEGTLHFAHISSEDGLLRVARSWDEHERQLVGALASTVSLDRAFLRSFIRPHGLAQPAAPLVVDNLERLADATVPRETSSWRRLPLRVALAAASFPVVWANQLARAPSDFVKRVARETTRWARRFLKAWPTRARTRTKLVRRFFTVWLRAAVRVRVERLWRNL